MLLCQFCSEYFSAKQYLDMHIRFKHPESTRPSSAEQIEMDRPNIPLTNATFTTHADLPTIVGSSDSDRPDEGRVETGESKRRGSDR